MIKQLLVTLALIVLSSQMSSYGQSGHIMDSLGNMLSLTAPIELVTHQWNAFVEEYSRQYSSRQEAISRFVSFSKNYQNIYEHNLLHANQPNHSTYTLGINELADLSDEEYHSRNTFSPPDQLEYNLNVKQLDESILGEDKSWDWRKKNAVSSVKNQGQCGSCWTFSAIGCIESLQQITTNKLEDLSEQNLLDCSRDGVNRGCKGGSMPTAFKYVAQKGIMSEESYAYKGKQSTCQYQKRLVAFNIGGHSNVRQQSGRQMKTAIRANPVAVGIDSKGSSFRFYSKGVFSGKCGTQIDHAVIVVGYNYDQYDSSNSYYIVKNSWGTKWGEDGYIRMVDNDQNGQGICGIQMWASYPYI